MNWDDLRYLLSLGREGTLLEGARALKVSPSTLSRRLRALEEGQGTRLFDKLKHGAVLTPAGERMVAVAEAMEALTHDLDAEIQGLDRRLEGTVRVASTELLGRHFLSDLVGFREKHPGIELVVDTGSTVVDLDQREADVALRLGMHAPGHLVGRGFGRMAYAVFGAHDLVHRAGSHRYGDYPWVGWDPSRNPRDDAWREEHAPGARVALRLTSMPNLVHAAERGVGLAVLPCLLGDSSPHLRRVGPHVDRSELQLWLLTHPKLRDTARVQAFTRYLRPLLERDRDLLEGRRRG